MNDYEQVLQRLKKGDVVREELGEYFKSQSSDKDGRKKKSEIHRFLTFDFPAILLFLLIAILIFLIILLFHYAPEGKSLSTATPIVVTSPLLTLPQEHNNTIIHNNTIVQPVHRIIERQVVDTAGNTLRCYTPECR